MSDEEILTLVCDAHRAIEENIVVTAEVQEMIRNKVLSMLEFIEEDMR